jgi:UDP-glucose 4-epimerase
MNILITGSEGFVGKNLVNLFLLDGYNVFSPTVVELDLTDFDSVSSYFDENTIDVIVHSATTLRNGTNYPLDTCENNLKMFFNLAHMAGSKIKLINFGSGSEYSRGFWHKKMHEDFFGTNIPKDSLGFSKYVISKYIEDGNFINMTTLRIFGIFGKFEDYRFKFISNAIAKNLFRMPILINQNVVYDYIYIDNFYEIVKFFVNNKIDFRSYNVTPSNSTDLLTIANTINKISNYKSDVVVLNDGVGVHYSGDNSRLLSSIKNINIMSLSESVLDLYQYYKSNISMLDRNELEKDQFLSYAKKLKEEYFNENT